MVKGNINDKLLILLYFPFSAQNTEKSQSTTATIYVGFATKNKF